MSHYFLLGVSLLILLLQATANSKVIYVSSSPTGTERDGSSWADATVYLQEALSNAQSGDEIWIAAGTYYPDEGAGQTDDDRNSTFNLKSGVAVYGGFPASGGTFTDRDISAHPTILSGNIDSDDTVEFNAYHIIMAIGVDASTVLDGLTIEGGYTGWEDSENLRGGAICCHAGASLELNYCIIRGNFGGRGGGLHSESSTPTLNHCSFLDNDAWVAGGIYCLTSTLTLNHCTISGNSALAGGGGIVIGGSSPTLTNCVISGNHVGAGSGGGISISDATPTLINCTISGNLARSRLGGGVHNSRSSPRLFNCIIWQNIARPLTFGGSRPNPSEVSVSNAAQSVPFYSHCLIHHYSKARLDRSGRSPNTNFEPINPLFVERVGDAPTVESDLRLAIDSPAINVGDDSANTEPTDLNGDPRKAARIDLGAYELAADTDGDGLPDYYEEANTISNSATDLAPDADQDSDGLTAIEEFAFGLSDLRSDPGNHTNISIYTDSDTQYQCIRYRRSWKARPSVSINVERSTDLSPGTSWTETDIEISETPNAYDSMVDAVIKRSGYPISLQDREFLRLRVEKR